MILMILTRSRSTEGYHDVHMLILLLCRSSITDAIRSRRVIM